MATELAKQCADKLYEAMEQLNSKDFPWMHNPHTFLPANVSLDQTHTQDFKELLAETVQKVLDQNRGKRL